MAQPHSDEAFDRLTQEALNLPEPARAELADRLLESLSGIAGTGLSSENEKELLRRIEAHERGEVTPIPAEEVFSRLRTRFSG